MPSALYDQFYITEQHISADKMIKFFHFKTFSIKIEKPYKYQWSIYRKCLQHYMTSVIFITEQCISADKND